MSFNVEENRSVYGAKMKVIGVGGGGCNMINHMIREGFDKVELIVANTDVQVLEKSLAKTKIQLGPNKTKGLGSGGKPEIGKESAEESFEDLKDTFEYADVVFIGAGFGGGTGTGATSVVARAARENKALTIGVVTTPFNFEGKKKFEVAKEYIEELKKECDSILVIPNQKLLTIIDKKAGLKECFKKVDGILAQAVSGMVSVILDSGDSDINIDFADVRSIMSHRGLALMGVGVSEGEEAAQEAVKNAIQSPLLDDISINGAKGVLVHFKIHPDCSLFEISEAMEIVREAIDEYADVKFGTTTDASIENNRVEVTLIATGFEEKADMSEVVSNETKNFRQQYIEKLKVSGGFDNGIYDELDQPTYTRNRMD